MNPDEQDRVSSWMTDAVPGLQRPLVFELIANGRSNLTYRVSDAVGRTLALRRPPYGERLPTAHDVEREFRILSALRDTPVPAPTPVALCRNAAVSGDPLYLMEFVTGHVIRLRSELESAFDAAERRNLSFALVEAMATLHAVDVDAVGLGSLSKRDEYIGRQLRRWWQQYGRSAGLGPDDRRVNLRGDSAVLAEIRDELAARIPQQSDCVLVHGDLRLANAIATPPATVTAILDWETCTLGEPLADLGILLMSWFEPEDEDLLDMRADGLAPTEADGMPSRREIVAHYQAVSGRSVNDVPFFYAFAWWRMACILHGVAARYRGGSSGGDVSSLEKLDAKARSATRGAQAALSRLIDGTASGLM